MCSRDLHLNSLRPKILINTINTDMSIEEYFQNTVLRPIIKFQNDLLIAVFLQFCTKYKNVFFDNLRALITFQDIKESRHTQRTGEELLGL